MLSISLQKKLFSVSGQMMLDVNFDIAKGSFVALNGVSGSGKTTLLRMIAGLEKPDGGELKVDNDTWYGKKIDLAPQKRKIGFVFQDYALFPNMSVKQNLLYAQNNVLLADELLEMTQLKELENQKPNMLSGGQKQRVALIRALMRKPDILLLDEPLSALDPLMRAKLQDDILAIHKEFNLTTILVSHDASEIYKLADRVITLQDGMVVSDKNPREHFLNAKNTHKFSLIGEVLDVYKVDAISVGVIAIGNMIVEVVLDKYEAANIKKGSSVTVSTKAFSPILY